MVHLYSPAVQQRCVKLGLTSPERIRRNSLLFKAVCIPGYIGYVLVCVYGINGAKGFVQGFWQLLVILSVMNLMDRLLVDGYWVGHTNVWTIPGTEDLKPYITAKVIKMLSSSFAISSSGAPGMSCTRKPPAALTLWSVSTSTPRPQAAGICSLSTR